MSRAGLALLSLLAIMAGGAVAADAVPSAALRDGNGEREPAHPSRQPPLPGADRDAHGCIGSAGYAWCARKKACVRPWELLRREGREVSEAEFRAKCSGTRQ
jgi:hypothetical protein